jgi:S-DNA-T family DNA segregation ATPase FtsK/SpoIIIE
MLFLKPGSARLQRIQGAFLDDNEVNDLVSNIRANSSAEYNEEAISWIESEYDKSKHGGKSGDNELIDSEMDDPKWDEALHIAQSQGQVSASYLQRSLKIGYNRAARIVETMEKNGLIGKANGVKARKWIGPHGSEQANS